MKKGISPATAVIVIVVAVVVIAAIGYALTTKRPNYAKPVVHEGPIPIAPSQQGTKLGGTVLGETFGGTPAPAPKGH